MKKFLSALGFWFFVQSPGHAAGLEVQLSFRCLWWSEAQMENFNPNNPPPKQTEVALPKWEYTDPVGVPHPDTFDLYALIKNKSDKPTEKMEVSVEWLWKEGSIKDQRKARWQKKAVSSLSLEAIKSGEAREVKIKSFDLKSKMDPLFKKAQWPWRLRAVVNISQGTEKTAQSIELPIQPGD